MYDGEVFTYRSSPASRPAAPRSLARQHRAADPDQGRAESMAAAERMARLEATVLRLEESLSHLTGVVQQMSAALDEVETARVEIASAPEVEPVVSRPQVAVQQVQMVREERPAPTPSDVKVSLFGGGATEAILGQVRVTTHHS